MLCDEMSKRKIILSLYNILTQTDMIWENSGGVAILALFILYYLKFGSNQ